MAASFTVAGVRVDHGSHRLHPSTAPPILDDLRSLLGADLQERQRHGRLRLGDRWVGFPLRAGELARTLPTSMLSRVGVESLTGPFRRGTPGSYADALRQGLGQTLYDSFYAPYAVKLWGLDGNQIDVEQARVRVSADTPGKIVRRMLRRGSGPGRTFYYPRRGFGQIVEALADAGAQAGADIRLKIEAARIRAHPGGVEISTSAGESLSAGHLFTTIPMPLLARLAGDAVPAEAIEAAKQLRFRSMVLVYLQHTGGRPWSEYDATYLPDGGTPITRISEPANYRDSADDPEDSTVLCCEIPCEFGDEVWEASDADLAWLVADTLPRLGLPPLQFGEVQVRRLRNAYPVYQIGYADYLRGLDDWAGSLPHVTTFGRLGLFAHDNTHHAIAMAYSAVDALAGGYWNAGSWAVSRMHFADHVVED